MDHARARMSAIKQILLSFIILVIAAAAWFGYQNRSLFFAPESTAAAAPSPGPAGGGAAPTNVAAAPPGGGGRPVVTGPGGGGGSGGPPGGARAVSVITDPVVIETIGDELRSIGSAAAKRAITIFPPASGMVTGIDVTAGDSVTEGQVLLTLASDDEQIAVDRAELQLTTAQAALERAERLAVGQNITEVALTEARTAVAEAEIGLRSAQLALDRRRVVAPFAGVVGLIGVSVGDIVSGSTELMTLDDLSNLSVTFEAPARFAGRIAVGHEVQATSESVLDMMRGAVTAVDSRIDETTRTFRVVASLDSGIAGLVPGMAVNVTVLFPGEERPTVSSLAVLWDSQGSYVWKIDSNRARRTPVQILSRQSGMVVVGADLQAGDEVIIEGYQRLRDGAFVTVTQPMTLPSASQTPVAAGPAATPQAVIPQEIAELIRRGTPLPAEAIARLREGGQLPSQLIDRLANGEPMPQEILDRLLGSGDSSPASATATPAAGLGG